VLLTTTFIPACSASAPGTPNILFGLVHLVIFAVFVFMVFVP
jgi:Ca2+:H+ antiporter